ncbi:MAG: lipopolysaccharide heptosyltransferase II [Coxiellaceae bacterium]|jgi:heptosyltransferase-2|nr:lipopolysaccharide heptosyltransferase II [Coxiellaceae bacterium]
MNYCKKVLVIAPSWVGDLVISQALLRLIKAKDPGCLIDVFISSFLHPILRRMPEVDNCLISPFKHGELRLITRFKIARSLRNNFYTHAYILPNSFKSALIPFFAGITHRIGWRGEMRYFLVNHMKCTTKKTLSMIEQYVTLGYEKNEIRNFLLPKLQISTSLRDATLKRLNILLSNKPILAICPGSSFGDAKRWPTDYFAKIAQIKKNEGWEIWIFGSNMEQILAQKIQEKCHNVCLDLTGKIDLGEAIDLLSLANGVLANDSGLMHISAALSKPLVAIYGPTSPEFAPPLSINKFKILYLNLPCSPCRKRWCPLQFNRCMHDLKPDMALQAINNIITTDRN